MPRQPRLVLEGMPHHVTQRGNYRQKIFESHKDFQRYSYWIMEYAVKYKVQIIAYCLMSNHVHFIVEPTTKDGLALLFNMTHMRYSQYKHAQKDKKGHLWQGRFYSSVLDDVHLIMAVRYVERNPVRACIVPKASDYIWSSARFHAGLEQEPIIPTYGRERIRRICSSEQSWLEYLNEEDEAVSALIREKTQKGGVIASKENISSIEQKFGIILQEKKKGRPKK
jgi:putative transposase